MGPAARLFDNKVVEEQIKRPQGQVDMLIGLHAAALFPTVENSEQDAVGNLRLLSTKFGTGWVVDGQHPEVVPSRMRMTLQVLHSRIDTVGKARWEITRNTNHVMSARARRWGSASLGGVAQAQAARPAWMEP